jgi:hypothetical protein
VPAAVGIFLLGDVPRPGWGWVAVVGFALAVAGALSLSRHGEMHAVDNDAVTGEAIDDPDADQPLPPGGSAAT